MMMKVFENIACWLYSITEIHFVEIDKTYTKSCLIVLKNPSHKTLLVLCRQSTHITIFQFWSSICPDEIINWLSNDYHLLIRVLGLSLYHSFNEIRGQILVVVLFTGREILKNREETKWRWLIVKISRIKQMILHF